MDRMSVNPGLAPFDKGLDKSPLMWYNAYLNGELKCLLVSFV